MSARTVLTGAIVAQAFVFASAVVVSQSREPIAPSDVPREAAPTLAALAAPTEAPAGFDLLTNGVVDPVRFEAALEEFTGPEGASDGLGPVFNAVGCGECHSTPVIGGSSQVTERRAGTWNGSTFTEHPGGSLIQDRSLFPGLQVRVLPGNNVLALRASLSILGLGFVCQNGGPQTRNRLRTLPLWGLRVRGRFMHDAASQSFDQAIARHAGQAIAARAGFDALAAADRARVLLFLSSL